MRSPAGKGGALVALLATLSLPAHGQSWNPFSSSSDDDKWAQKLEPSTFHFPNRNLQRRARVLKFRFYADPDFRGLTPSWKLKTRAWLSQLSRMIEPALAVQFEAESQRNWDHHAALGSLGDALAALARQDPGTDVDFVVGLVGALPAMTDDHHLLGMAHPPQRHFVLRAMGNVHDARQVYRLLDKSDVGRKEDLYARRVQHKELAIFLHEWAHAMGVPHTGCGSDIMCPSYSPGQSGFRPSVVEYLADAINRPPGGGGAPPVARSEAKAPEKPEVAPPAAQQAAAAAWVGRQLEQARDQHRTGDRAGAAGTLGDAVDRARVVAAPGDPVWLTLAEACLELGAPGPAAEALSSAAPGAAADALRARLPKAKARKRR
jgi:hypothetical protein